MAGPGTFGTTTSDLLNFLESIRERSPEYLTQMSNLVSRYKGKTVSLKRPAGAEWKIGDLQSTVYKSRPKTAKEWGMFYLPKEVTMQVLGVVEGTPYPCEDELVMMTCEDKKIYAYGDQELHVVATSLNELCTNGIDYPASKSYYNGEAFQNMTQEDWDKLRKGPVGRKLDEEYSRLMKAEQTKFLNAFKATDSGHTYEALGPCQVQRY